MTIRRKTRHTASETGRPVPQIRSDVVQKNLERMRQIANVSATRRAVAPDAGQQAPATVYRARSEADLANVGEVLSADPAMADATPTPFSHVEEVLSAAGEQVLTAMQQAQSSIMGAETILQNNAASTEERIAEAQRIAERAVANALGQSEAVLQAAVHPRPANAPGPGEPEILPPESSVRDQVR